jgi:prophage DNA circulation protein
LFPVIPYKSLEEILDIIKALNQRASVLRDELGKIHQAIRALSGAKTGVRNAGRKFRHTAATKRKLRAAQKKIWAAKRKRK